MRKKDVKRGEWKGRTFVRKANEKYKIAEVTGRGGTRKTCI